MLSVHSASPKDLGIFNFVLTYFCKLSQSLCEKNRGTEHINKTMEWSTINKTAEERIYPGQLSVQCVLCILIRLKALRETYHFNDKTLLDLSHFFFFFLSTKKISKGQNFLIWNKFLFFSGTSFMDLSKTKEKRHAEGHRSLWCLRCTWHSWI